MANAPASDRWPFKLERFRRQAGKAAYRIWLEQNKRWLAFLQAEGPVRRGAGSATTATHWTTSGELCLPAVSSVYFCRSR